MGKPRTAAMGLPAPKCYLHRTSHTQHGHQNDVTYVFAVARHAVQLHHKVLSPQYCCQSPISGAVPVQPLPSWPEARATPGTLYRFTVMCCYVVWCHDYLSTGLIQLTDQPLDRLAL
jgi:hypothetical protein